MPLPRPLQGLRLPVVAAPMFLVSGPELVVAQAAAGIVGSFPSLNARPQAQLADWLAEIRDRLTAYDAAHPAQPAAPYAVNLVVHRSNDRLDADLATVVEHRIPIVITSLGVRPEVTEAVHGYGGIVLHDVVNNAFARKAVDRGADGLIAVAAGAGGHTGSISPFALLHEIRQWFTGPLVLSGSIAHGRSVLAARTAGADLAYIGSAFIATDEARASDTYKQMVVTSTSADVIATDVFSGVSANYLAGSMVAAGLDPERLDVTARPAVDVSAAAEERPGPKAWRDIWGAGHGIGALDRVLSTADLVGRLEREYARALADLVHGFDVDEQRSSGATRVQR